MHSFVTSLEFFAASVVGAFILGALEGGRLWAWLKSWVVKEETKVYDKLTGHTGPTGA